MKKIPTLFVRDFVNSNGRLVTPDINPECVWVVEGEGVATRKYDGTCCLIRFGRLFKRYETKKMPPPDFELVDSDLTTGKVVGWRLIGDSPEDKWHREAYVEGLADGTYELLGPKVQGNPESYPRHTLLRHADAETVDAPRTFDGLRQWLEGCGIEGVVWHHPDGRMAKIKAKDFGFRR